VDPKGQTSLEYLLITVVAIGAVVGIIVFMQSNTVQLQNESSCNFNTLLCPLQDCGNDNDCRSGKAGEVCGQWARCVAGNCVGYCSASAAPCTDGNTRSCYSGDPSKINIGVCTNGTQTCTSGAWGSCIGEVLPVQEALSIPWVCTDSQDNDCDGIADTDPECVAPVPTCYTVTDVPNKVCTVDPNNVPVGKNGCDCINEALSKAECTTVELDGSISNYNAGSGWCAVLDSNDILDCKDNKIDGVSLINSIGIYVRGDYAVVRNCVVSEFYFGFEVIGESNQLSDNIAELNTMNGFFITGFNNVLDGNEGNNNLRGFELEAGSYLNTLQNNKALDNTAWGLYMALGSHDNTLDNNEACDNVVFDVKDDGTDNMGSSNTCDPMKVLNWHDTDRIELTDGCKTPCTAATTCYTRVDTTCTVDPANLGAVVTDACTCINTALAAGECTTVKLEGGITNYAGGTCISISSSDKTLDCNGHTLDGVDSVPGISLYNVQNVTVANCVLTDWANAFDLYSVSESRITNNILTSNRYGALTVRSSDYNNITDNTASQNGNEGIILQTSSHNKVLRNKCNSNRDGIGIIDSNYNVISDNPELNSNSGSGIYVTSGSFNTISGNTANGNSDCGFNLQASSSNNVLTGNTACNTGQDLRDLGTGNSGYLNKCMTCPSGWCSEACTAATTCYTRFDTTCTVDPTNLGADVTDPCTCINEALADVDCATVELAGDITNYAGGNCVSMTSTANNKILDCTDKMIDGIDTSNTHGISLSGVSGAQVRNCQVTDWSDGGIHLVSSSGNILSDNTANDNMIGIYLASSSGNNLSDNTAYSNLNYGIRLFMSSFNNLTSNTVSDGAYSISLEVSCNSNLLSDNIVSNGLTRIYLDGSSNTITRNTACGSSGEDIEIHSGNFNTGLNNKCDQAHAPAGWCSEPC